MLNDSQGKSGKQATEIGEQPITVILAYLIAFIPLGILNLFDFRNHRWRKLKHVRRAANINLFLSMEPCITFTLYILKQFSFTDPDFKEAAAGIVALSLSLDNIKNSAYALFQIYAFRHWCFDCLKCMESMGIRKK